MGTLAYSVLSSLVPIFNIEVYLVALATQIPRSAALPVAIAAGIGQAVGKIAWYHGVAKSLEFPWMRRRMESEKWNASYEKWQRRVDQRPWAAGAMMFWSALVGLPPLLLVCPLAGVLKMRMSVFLLTIFVGRAIQSYVILLGFTSIFH